MRPLLLAMLLLGCRNEGQRAPRPIAPRAASATPAVLPWAHASRADAIPAGGPVIALDGATITLDGTSVARTDGKITLGILSGFDDLTVALRDKREAWRAAHAPTEPFPGVVVTRIPARTAIPIVRLIVNSAALAGYPFVHHVVRTDDGTREGTVQLGATIPSMGNEPARLVVHLGAKEISFVWSDESAKPPSLARELLRPGNEPLPALVDGLRAAWATAPSGAREWIIATRDCETHETVIALVDAIGVARNGDATLSLPGRAVPGACE